MLAFIWLLETFWFCTLSSIALAKDYHISFAERNLNTIRKIYNLTVYPNQLPIIAQGGSAVPSGLFSPSASGRVTPIGNFTSFEDSIEYSFALAPVPVRPRHIALR